MKTDRRELLEIVGGASALALLVGSGWMPRAVAAAELPDPLAPNDHRKQFDSHTLDVVVKDLGGSNAQQSSDIQLTAPDIAENGAVVPIEIESKLPNTRSIAIVTEKNPRALTAVFNIPDGTEPYVSTRVKLAETAKVTALVRTDKGFFYTDKLVKVTLGGCGG